MLRKVFPFDAESSFFNSFSIIFVSEGFLASESALFTSHCLDFTNRLMEYPPFNLTRINSNWLSVYSSFKASDNHGPIINSGSIAGRTAFESTVNTGTGLMTFNTSKINDHLESESLREYENEYQMSETLNKGVGNYGYTGTLVVLLLPQISGHAAGADFESEINEENYHFIATSADGYWHQVVIRGICKLMGLGDEYEQTGTEYLAPDPDGRKELVGYPNIQYFETAPTEVKSNSKWFKLYSAVKQEMPAEVYPKTGDTSIPDTSLDSKFISYDVPAFCEGAGGYRTKVYRSCRDSLMRRKIGSLELPLRNRPLALSPASFYFIKNVIS